MIPCEWRPPLTNLQRTSASTAARPIKVSPPIFAILTRTPSQSALKNCDFNYLTPQPPDFSQIDVPAKQGRARLKLTSTKFSCSRPILFPTPANPKRNPPNPTELSPEPPDGKKSGNWHFIVPTFFADTLLPILTQKQSPKVSPFHGKEWLVSEINSQNTQHEKSRSNTLRFRIFNVKTSYSRFKK